MTITSSTHSSTFMMNLEANVEEILASLFHFVDTDKTMMKLTLSQFPRKILCRARKIAAVQWFKQLDINGVDGSKDFNLIKEYMSFRRQCMLIVKERIAVMFMTDIMIILHRRCRYN